MRRELYRKSPEELLHRVQAEEAAALTGSGHLKIFLGYASGVGKSFRMLDEARRRRERGEDVVIGAIQPKMPAAVEALLPKLEVIPLRHSEGGIAMDLDALLHRRPRVCVIDGLAHDNPPGSRNPTRWQDVLELQEAGIKVITSINLQYVEELRGQVEAITGKHVAETVPVSFVRSADDIEIVDAPPPEEPDERSGEEREEARRRQERLSRLRELALVLAADVVEDQLNRYLERNGIRQHFDTNERILVCITPRANLEEMLDEALTAAERFHGELIVAYVRQAGLSPADQSAIDDKLTLASTAGARIEILEGENPAETLLEYARSRGITQLFVGHSRRKGLARLRGSPLDRLIWEGRGMDVRVFPH